MTILWKPPTTRPTDVPAASMPRGTLVRLGACAVLCAVLVYIVLFWNPGPVLDPVDTKLPEPALVDVPTLDRELLGKAKDRTREERLFLEAEPLSHLLSQSLNVSPEAARAMGMPERMPPVAALRTHPAEWRGRWIWFRGEVETIEGPRPGHPVPGYSVFEALLKLDDGSRVLFAFSRPPAEGLAPGAVARAEGYVLKMRDLAMPEDLREVPMLVGAELRLDYRQWEPVTNLDPEVLAKGGADVVEEGGRLVPSPETWKSIDVVQRDDQVLWHLSAYARDGAPKTMTEWRRIPALNAQEIWDGFKKNETPRGTPLRVLGMLAAARTIQAQPNPAGIEDWTEAWVQVRDLGGKAIPIWVPGRNELPLGSSLEVRGYYLRRYTYTTRSGEERWAPLFVAARLDPFVFDGGHRMTEAASWALGVALLFMLLLIVGARREGRRSRAQEDALLQRRKNRRHRRPNDPDATHDESTPQAEPQA